MMKVMTERFTKNRQSTDTTLEWVECSIARIIDRVDALELQCHQQIKRSILMTLMRMSMMRRMTRSPSTLHIHHHVGSTVMTSRATKSFHTLHVDQMGKVWEVTLIVALINSMLAVMIILLLKLSL
jgi:hypothetical protein